MKGGGAKVDQSTEMYFAFHFFFWRLVHFKIFKNNVFFLILNFFLFIIIFF